MAATGLDQRAIPVGNRETARALQAVVSDIRSAARRAGRRRWQADAAGRAVEG